MKGLQQVARKVESSIMTAERGIVTYATVLCALKDLAALAGITKNVTTHILGKSTGTHRARHDPKLAREQLGITQKTFDLHYSQPRLQDRQESRDIIPASTPSYASVEALIGAFTIQLKRGQISQAEWDRKMAQIDLEQGLHPKGPAQGPSVT